MLCLNYFILLKQKSFIFGLIFFILGFILEKVKMVHEFKVKQISLNFLFEEIKSHFLWIWIYLKRTFFFLIYWKQLKASIVYFWSYLKQNRNSFLDFWWINCINFGFGSKNHTSGNVEDRGHPFEFRSFALCETKAASEKATKDDVYLELACWIRI